MKRTLSTALSTGVSALAVAAALSFSATTAQAVPCVFDPAEPYNPGTLTADITCAAGLFDPVTNSTPGGFGRRSITIFDSTITGTVLNDIDSVLDATGSFGFPPLFIDNSLIQGDVINNGLIVEDDGGNFTVNIFDGSVFNAFINNGFIFSTAGASVLNFTDSTSNTGIVNNGTASGTGGTLFDFTNFTILAGGFRSTILSTMNSGGDILNFNGASQVTGNIDLDGVGTSTGGDLLEIEDTTVVTGNVFVRGAFTVDSDGVEVDDTAVVDGRIEVSGTLLTGSNGIFVDVNARVTGNIIVQAGALVQGDDDGIDIEGFLGPVNGASNIQIFGTVRGGGGEAIDLFGARNAIVTELFDGGLVAAGGSRRAFESRSGFNDTLLAFGGTVQGQIRGDSSALFFDPESDSLIVQAAALGTIPMAMDLRDPNNWGHFFWSGGDNQFGLPVSLFTPADIDIDIVSVQRGAAFWGDTAYNPHLQSVQRQPNGLSYGVPANYGLNISNNGAQHTILTRQFTIGSVPQPALAFFDQSVLTKVAAPGGGTFFTVAAGSTLVLETGFTDTRRANQLAGGAIAALTIPTPNDKCDYFSVNCPYYNAAGFGVQIPRFLVQNGNVNGANLALATDSLRFIRAARSGDNVSVYDDVIQDLNNVGDFLTGPFASVTTTAPVFITANARYRNLNEVDVAAGNYDNIDLELTTLTFEQAAATANKRAVGWALDNFTECAVNGNTCPAFFNDNLIAGTTLTGDWVTILQAVSELKTAADYATFGWNVQGDQYAQASQFGMNLLEYWTQGVNNRLRNALYSQNGVNWADNGGVQVASLGTAGLSGLGTSGTALGAAKGGSDGWAFWGRGIAQFADEDGDAEARGYEYDTLGFQGGVDWTSSSGTFLFGGSVLWSQSEIEFAGAGLDHADVDTLQGGVYATYGFGNWYWNAQASIARNDVELNRVIDFNLQLAPGGNFFERTQLWSGYTQTGWTAGTEIGTVWNGGDWNIQPYLGLKYRDLSAEDIVERSRGQGQVALPGGGLPGTPRPSPFALTVVDADAESLQSELGARFTTNWDFEGTMIRPEIEVSWLHEFLDTRQTALAHFNSALTVTTGTPTFFVASPNFQIVSSDIGEDAGQVKLGFNAVLDDNWELYAGYRGLFTDGFQDHGATITIKANW